MTDSHDDVAAALAVTDAFTAAFNARDPAGMDATLHFPHVILSVATTVIWERPGQLPAGFFADLAARTGWHHSAYLERRPVLAVPDKAHIFVRYTRNRADGSEISRHDNLWIIDRRQGRWGIALRSY